MATRGKRILLGCGLGCLGLMVLSIGGCVGFFSWLNRPGELLESERLIGPATTGMIELHLRLEDPGTDRFIRAILDTSERINAGAQDQLPRSFRSFIIGRQSLKNEKQLEALLPIAVVWTVHPDDSADGDVHLFSVSVESLGNRLSVADWVMGFVFRLSPDLVAVQHRDERIYTFKDYESDFEGAAFVRDKDLFISSSVENAKRAVDLLRGETGTESYAGVGVSNYFEELPDLPLRGAFSNERGEAYRLWMNIIGGEDEDGWREEPWSGIRALLLSGGFVDETSVEGQIDLVCNSAEWAEAHADDFAGNIRVGDEGGNLALTLEPEAIGDRIRVRFRIDDLIGWLDHLEDDD